MLRVKCGEVPARDARLVELDEGLRLRGHSKREPTLATPLG